MKFPEFNGRKYLKSLIYSDFYHEYRFCFCDVTFRRIYKLFLYFFIFPCLLMTRLGQSLVTSYSVIFSCLPFYKRNPVNTFICERNPVDTFCCDQWLAYTSCLTGI
jgi:hypothetical protein